MIPQTVRFWVVCCLVVSLSACGPGLRTTKTSAGTSTSWYLSATQGTIGSILILSSASDLTEVENVTIGGTSALFLSRSQNELKTMVMPGSTTGDITVEYADGRSGVAGAYQVISSIPPSQQQGQKLVGTGGQGVGEQGYSLALSADGNTALLGGYRDNSY